MSSGQEEILIERREIVARIPLSPNGSINPIEAAFTEMGKYFAGHDDQQGFEVGFELWNRDFTASIGPEPSYASRKVRHEEDY
jgi:hypothetical protein